jgi:hypothetical protein
MEDKESIDQIVRKFFNLFTNADGRSPDLRELTELFLPEGIIIKNVSRTTEVFSVESFIRPRQKILTDGTLMEFREEELSERSEIYGSIAQRFCTYKKSGILSGVWFETHGAKTFQFVRKEGEWKISAVAWDDEK